MKLRIYCAYCGADAGGVPYFLRGNDGLQELDLSDMSCKYKRHWDKAIAYEVIEK